MKTTYISDIKNQEVIQDFFIVKNIGFKIGANKKEYMDMTVGDKTGDISCKKWDISEEIDNLKKIKEGDIVKLRAGVKEWNNSKQLNITKIRKSIPNDNMIIADFIRTAPEKPEDMFKFIYEIALSLEDEQLRKLCTARLEREKDRLLYYPAATRNHHSVLGGLLYHMKRMLITGDKICQVYEILDRSLLLTGVIMHDMEKLNEIVSNEMGVANEYSFEGNMLGHLVLGVRELEKEMESLNVDREKSVMVEHMVLSHHYEPEFGSPVKPMFPEAEILHYLDIIDARMYDMEEILNKTEAGTFSDRIWSLENRRIYKKHKN